MILKNELNLMRIVMDLFNADLYRLKNQDFYELDEVALHEFKQASDGNDINSIMLIIDRLLKKATEKREMDQIIFLSYFLYRYIYFYRTLTDWEKYVEEEKEIKINDTGTMFLENIAPFFDKQIEFFITNYKNYIESLKIEELSPKLVKELNELIHDIDDAVDFENKLVAVEKLTKYFQDSKNLTGLLEGEFNEEKETFLTLTNEIKVDFQSMDNLINLILAKLREMKVN
jgi:hypothetical protein